ncbi:alpha/beta fold hydrolase [Streptomyces kanasensis]|uniref:alpha/beta fold hydrolase n=1 Tax=Streptomyces kanasensis TaxID=936756 RepID=UPI0037FF5CDC
MGRGPPVVLAYGATTDAHLFRPQTEDLADEFTLAGCLAAVVEDVYLGPAHVPGLSWGRTVVLELYRHHADDVEPEVPRPWRQASIPPSGDVAWELSCAGSARPVG